MTTLETLASSVTPCSQGTNTRFAGRTRVKSGLWRVFRNLGLIDSWNDGIMFP